jgi:hypothetical protein
MTEPIEKMLRKLAIRDALILLATVLVWQAAASGGASGGAVATGISILAGVLVAGCGFLAHEWGHLTGARLSGSVVHVPGRLGTIFLFHFDSDRNRRSQFVWMSIGGILTSWLLAGACLALLPFEGAAGRVAVSLVCLGAVVATALEGPIAWRVARGAPIPRGYVYASSDTGPGAAA